MRLRSRLRIPGRNARRLAVPVLTARLDAVSNLLLLLEIQIALSRTSPQSLGHSYEGGAQHSYDKNGLEQFAKKKSNHLADSYSCGRTAS